jgi:hypothetical protein
MQNLILDVHNDGLAFILAAKDDGEPTRLATVYRMKDGWHTKLASQHTRHAWAGPFESAQDALEAMRAPVSELA